MTLLGRDRIGDARGGRVAWRRRYSAVAMWGASKEDAGCMLTAWGREGGTRSEGRSVGAVAGSVRVLCVHAITVADWATDF